MKIREYIAYSLFVWISLFLSCSEDKHSLCPTGILYLNVQEDATLHTKAQTGVTFESLRVDVLDMNRDTVNTYKDYLSDVKDQRMTLPVGKYIVAVSSNHTGEAGWETPLYRGEEEVEVKQGEITSAQVVCKITNTKVSVLYADTLKTVFSHYGTTVSNSSGSLTFTRDEYRSGYFTPEELTVSLRLVNRDGNEFVIRKIYPDIKPQYHYKFKFDLADESEDKEAGADFGIEIDSTYEEIQYNIFIKEEESLFGKGVPKLKLTGFGEEAGENKSLSWKPLKNGERQPLPDPAPQLTLNVPTGIQDIKVDVNSARFTSDDLHINKSVEGEQVIDLNNLLQQAYEWTELTTQETHSFAVRVLDNLNQEAAIAFSLITAPDLPATTYDANAFSTFAFLKGSSDETENVRFKYWEKSAGASSAQEVSANPNGDGSFAQVIKNLKPDTEYCCQALAGEDVEGDIKEFTTEKATKLPGGNFDEWDGNTPNASSVSPFWGSGNNDFTKSLLSPTSDFVKNIEGNKQAANLQSTSAFSTFAAGNLFTGDFKLDGMTGEITFGRSFNSRPTKLKGYYKYFPGEIKNSGSITTPSGVKIDVSGVDTCSVYIALVKNKYTIRTDNTNSFFDLNSSLFKENVIAHAELPAEECGTTNGEYKSFELTLNYFQPDYTGNFFIVVVCSSSKYGDYFKGSTKSNLKLDEFELDYEYDENCFNNK